MSRHVDTRRRLHHIANEMKAEYPCGQQCPTGPGGTRQQGTKRPGAMKAPGRFLSAIRAAIRTESRD